MNTRLPYVKKKIAKYKLLVFQGFNDTINHIQEITPNSHNNIIINVRNFDVRKAKTIIQLKYANSCALVVTLRNNTHF